MIVIPYGCIRLYSPFQQNICFSEWMSPFRAPNIRARIAHLCTLSPKFRASICPAASAPRLFNLLFDVSVCYLLQQKNVT